MKTTTQRAPKSVTIHVGDSNWQKKVRQKLLAIPDKLNPTITFDLPIPPSVNKIYATSRTGGRTLTQEGREWKKQAKEIAYMEALRQKWKMCCNTKVVVELTVFWPDTSRARDMNNLHKILADALEKSIYFNDKLSLIRDMDFSIDGKKPRLELVIYQQRTPGQNTQAGGANEEGK